MPANRLIFCVMCFLHDRLDVFRELIANEHFRNGDSADGAGEKELGCLEIFEEFRDGSGKYELPIPSEEDMYEFLCPIGDQVKFEESSIRKLYYAELLTFFFFKLSQMDFSTECYVVALLYIERLSLHSGIRLRVSNWRLLTLIALMIATKVWDDCGASNSDFARLMNDSLAVNDQEHEYPQQAYSTRDINKMEALFLEHINYDVGIAASVFMAVYFDLRDMCEFDAEPTCSTVPKPLTPISVDEAKLRGIQTTSPPNLKRGAASYTMDRHS